MYGILFDQAIKVTKGKYSAERLWGFIMYGAMVLYASNGGSIDIVSRVCDMQQTFFCCSVMAILEQVKNTEEYKLNFIKKFVLTA